MTNLAGVEHIKTLGFPTTKKFGLYLPENVYGIDLDELYRDAPSGATIYVNYRGIKIDHGPNGIRPIKIKTSNGVPREKFFETFEEMRQNCKLPLYDQIFGVCQTICQLDAIISGICVKDDQDGFGRLTAEATFGMRKGDFDPHLSIGDQIVGDRRIAHNRQFNVAPVEKIPSQHQHLYSHKDLAIYHMLDVMRTTMRNFGEGITGIEFMVDLRKSEIFFVDFYHSRHPNPDTQAGKPSVYHTAEEKIEADKAA